MDKIRKFFETIVVAAILLVLVQTFLEDYAVLAGWSWPARKALVFSAFCFDLFFTLEFLIRFFNALSRREAKTYLTRGRGWIDFVASIPLILFVSGPYVAALLVGGGTVRGAAGILNVLKVAKVVRIARILRLLRVLKIFKKIKYAGSFMGQRHTAKITTVAISAVVVTFFLWSLLESGGVIPRSLESEFLRARETSAITLAGELDQITESGVERERLIEEKMEEDPNLLIVKQNGETLHSRYTNPELSRKFGPGDYGYLHIRSYGLFFSRVPLEKHRSGRTLLFFFLVIALVVVFLLYYSPHFAVTVTDPIHVMRKGMTDGEYNLEVEIPEEYRHDDVFELAELYNREYLPLKERMAAEEEDTKKSGLSLSDIGGLFEKEGGG
ncbi:MAG: ion transporter [Spirochaetaceae bacterium]